LIVKENVLVDQLNLAMDMDLAMVDLKVTELAFASSLGKELFVTVEVERLLV